MLTLLYGRRVLAEAEAAPEGQVLVVCGDVEVGTFSSQTVLRLGLAGIEELQQLLVRVATVNVWRRGALEVSIQTSSM